MAKSASSSQEGGRKAYFKKVATNRKARHEFHIEEIVEAGIELHGSEVKSLRQGKVDFADAYARIEQGQLWVVGLRISIYEKTFVAPPDPARRRRLLVKKSELNKLQQRAERSGYTLVPLEIYFKGSWAKMKIGIARGKAKADKRQTLKANEAKRDIERAIKHGRSGRGRL